MIIDKVEAYRTDEDRKTLERITQEREDRLNALEKSNLEDPEYTDQVNDTMQTFYFEFWEIEKGIENRYISDRSVDELMADAKEIINAIDMEDFKNFLEDNKKPFSEKIPSRRQLLSEQTEANRDNCYIFMTSCIATQSIALRDNNTAIEFFINLIQKRLDVLFPSQFMLVSKTEYSRDLDYMSSKKGEINRVYGDFKAVIGDLTVIIEKYDTLKGTLGINTNKLLMYIIGQFTNIVNFKNAKKMGAYSPYISFTLKEYAEAIGRPLKNEAQIKKFRQSVDKDIELLHKQEIRWDIVGKEKRKTGFMRLISAGEIERKQKGEKAEDVKIKVRLDNTFSEALINGSLSQYPKVLLKIDARDANTYFIGTKLADHYSMDGNYTRGTHNRLKVEILLKKTDLPDYKTLKGQNNRHWKERIKTPFEKSLNDLIHKYEYLKSWRYAHPKGIPLTDEEIKNIKSYDDFKDLYILFEPVDEPKRKAFKPGEKEAKEIETD